jgi:hypothetical protein
MATQGTVMLEFAVPARDQSPYGKAGATPTLSKGLVIGRVSNGR